MTRATPQNSPPNDFIATALKGAGWRLQNFMDSEFVNTRFPYTVSVIRYIRTHKRLPNLVYPVRFNDIVLKRKLRDPRPLITETVCKKRGKEYVKRTVGEEYAIEDFGVYANPADIPWADFTYPIIVKPTNGWAQFRMFNAPDEITADDIAVMTKWLEKGVFERFGEKNYRGLPREIIVEKKLVADCKEEGLREFKIFCFHGKVAFVCPVFGRNDAAESTRAVYTQGWRKLPFGFGEPPCEEDLERPKELDEMLRLAEKLSDPFKMVRIDLYTTGGRVYVGEITHNSGDGLQTFSIPEYEYWAGAPYYAPSDKERI